MMIATHLTQHLLLHHRVPNAHTCTTANLRCWILLRIHGTKHTTIIRNVAGDVPAFLNELRAVLKLPLGKKGVLTSASTGAHGGGEAGRGVNANNPIRIRSGGAIEVNGDRAREVKKWPAGLGF